MIDPVMLTRPNYEKFKKAAWYRDEPPQQIDPALVKLLEERGIPSTNVRKHVQEIHHRAFEVHPWPCVAGYSFLKTLMSKMPVFQTVLPRLQNDNATILDVGCALGQDIRILTSNNVPPRNIYALDFTSGFFDIGYQLFNDRPGTGKGMEEVSFELRNFVSDPPQEWFGKMDYVFAGAFFHVFNWDDQLTASRNAAKMLKNRNGSLIFGYQLGRDPAGHSQIAAMGTSDNEMMWRHDEASFKEMWRNIGTEMDIQFDIRITVSDQGIDDFRKRDDRMRLMTFVVERVEPNSNL